MFVTDGVYLRVVVNVGYLCYSGAAHMHIFTVHNEIHLKRRDQFLLLQKIHKTWATTEKFSALETPTYLLTIKTN